MSLGGYLLKNQSFLSYLQKTAKSLKKYAIPIIVISFIC